MKNIFDGRKLLILTLMLGIFLLGCSSSKSSHSKGTTEKNASLEAQQQLDVQTLKFFFETFTKHVQSRNAEAVYASLSESSLDWIEDMKRSASFESKGFLSQRPFYEIVAILGLRVQSKQTPELLDDSKLVVKRLLLDSYAVRKNFTKYEFAEYQVDRDRGQVGIKKAPQVPVFFFINEGRGDEKDWKLDLVESMPLIFLGAEKYARQIRSTPLDQAIYILKNVAKVPVSSSDLY